MDTKGNKKARRLTKLAWCERRKDNPRKKVSRRSQEAGKAGAAGETRPDIRQVKKVTPMFGAWMLAAALVAAVLLLGVA